MTAAEMSAALAEQVANLRDASEEAGRLAWDRATGDDAPDVEPACALMQLKMRLEAISSELGDLAGVAEWLRDRDREHPCDCGGCPVCLPEDRPNDETDESTAAGLPHARGWNG